jgi:hypothetical protein
VLELRNQRLSDAARHPHEFIRNRRQQRNEWREDLAAEHE